MGRMDPTPPCLSTYPATPMDDGLVTDDADVAVLVEELIQMMRKRHGLCEEHGNQKIFEEFVDVPDLQGPFCQVTQNLAYFVDCYFFSLRLESHLVPFRGLKLVVPLEREKLG